MSNYVSDYMKPQVEEADFDHECRQISIIEAAKGIALVLQLEQALMLKVVLLNNNGYGTRVKM